jgi:HSP20 family molecular chaperone IbpA
MEQMFRHFFNGDVQSMTGWVPDAEAHVSDGRLVVRCDLPGVEPADIHVAVRGRTLVISGERKAQQQVSDDGYWMRGITYGSFERSFSLPEGIDPNAVKATHRNGVLGAAAEGAGGHHGAHHRREGARRLSRTAGAPSGADRKSLEGVLRKEVKTYAGALE